MTVTRLVQLVIVALLGCGGAVGTVAAHHSAVAWNMSERITVVGTVKVVAFRNPHAHLELLVEDADHKLITWNVEGSSLTILARRGWKTGLVHVGDKITVSGHPNKTEPHAIYMREVTLQDGTTFGDPEGQDKALD
ncbi:MAG: DUF6152 family protein [Steroidobacteraceae bacterium]